MDVGKTVGRRVLCLCHRPQEKRIEAQGAKAPHIFPAHDHHQLNIGISVPWLLPGWDGKGGSYSAVSPGD